MTLPESSPHSILDGESKHSLQGTNALLALCVKVIAWITRIIFWLTLIGVLIRVILAGLILGISVCITATFLFFYLVENSGLLPLFDWTINDWRESENPAKQTAFKIINITTNVFLASLAIGVGIWFFGVFIDVVIKVGTLTMAAICTGIPMIVLFLERIIPTIDQLISPRNNTDIYRQKDEG